MGKVTRLSNEQVKQVLKRDELREYIEDGLHWAKGHMENVIIGAIAVSLAVFGLYYFSSSRGESASRASLQLSGAQQQFAQSVSGGGPQGLAQAQAAFQAVKAEFDGRSEAEAAELGLAASEFEQGKFEEARAAYERFLASHGSSALAPLARSGQASSLEGLGRLKEAAAAHEQAASAEHAPAPALSLMEAARCLEAAGDQPGLRAAVAKLADLDKAGRIPESLKTRWLSLKSRLEK